MTKYIKDSIVYNNLNSIVLNGKQIINPKESMILEAGYEVYTEPVIEENLEDAISNKVIESTNYADSDELNSYVAMGVTIRLPLELRLRLRNVINAKIALGETEMTEYYEGNSYTYPLTAWDIQLTQYENYLYEVACKAEQHKLNIQSLTTIEEVNAYDFTTGYPEQLNFDTINSESNN